MKALRTSTQPHNIALIEGAAHFLDGRAQDGEPISACVYSDMAALSLHPTKPMTTARGGTNNEKFDNSVRLNASHGITKHGDALSPRDKQSPWFYCQRSSGFNHRLSDLHAALGNRKNKRLNSLIAMRRTLAERHNSALSNLPLVLQQLDKNSVWHIYKFELTKHDGTTGFNALRKKGIGVNVHHDHAFRHVDYQNIGFIAQDFHTCGRCHNNAITLLRCPELMANTQDKVIKTLNEVL